MTDKVGLRLSEVPLVFISRVPPKGYEVYLTSFPKKQPPHFKRLLQFMQSLECFPYFPFVFEHLHSFA